VEVLATGDRCEEIECLFVMHDSSSVQSGWHGRCIERPA
jgi:hypothetical protein